MERYQGAVLTPDVSDGIHQSLSNCTYFTHLVLYITRWSKHESLKLSSCSYDLLASFCDIVRHGKCEREVFVKRRLGDAFRCKPLITLCGFARNYGSQLNRSTRLRDSHHLTVCFYFWCSRGIDFDELLLTGEVIRCGIPIGSYNFPLLTCRCSLTSFVINMDHEHYYKLPHKYALIEISTYIFMRLAQIDAIAIGLVLGHPHCYPAHMSPSL